MDIKTCKLLAQYNQVTNKKMDALIRNLSKTQWNQELEGYFKSIHRLCSHLYISDYNWLKRFGKSRDFHFMQDPLFDQDLNFSSNPFDEIEDYILKREELDKKIIRFVEEITDSDLAQTLSFKNTKGEAVQKNFGGSIMHVFNHQSHHRGMISLYLDNMKIENDFSSLLPLVEK